jgi:hypothetical protein
MSTDDPPPEFTPTLTLLCVLAMVLSWQLTAAVYIGKWLFGPGWFGPHKVWATLSVSVILTVIYRVWGRGRLQEYHRLSQSRQQFMTWTQAALVVVLMIAAGSFGAWLFVAP